MSRLSLWLADLGAATEAASSAEEAYRRNFARRVAELAEARAFAFRRANLVRALADAVAGAEDEQAAVAHGLAVLRTRLGWSSDSEARSEILARFAPVCAAMFEAMSDGEDAACFETPPASRPAPQHDEDNGIHRMRHAEERSEGSRLEARTTSPTEDRPDPAAALAAFEDWYRQAKGSAFWVLFENVIPETPLVDF